MPAPAKGRAKVRSDLRRRQQRKPKRDKTWQRQQPAQPPEQKAAVQKARRRSSKRKSGRMFLTGSLISRPPSITRLSRLRMAKAARCHGKALDRWASEGREKALRLPHSKRP